MGELPQVLAGHLLPAAPATAPAPGAMLVPLPGTPAFQEWTASLLDEARRQRCTKGGQKSTYWNALRCMAMTRRRNPRRRAAACSAVGRSTGVERLAVPHGAATIFPRLHLRAHPSPAAMRPYPLLSQRRSRHNSGANEGCARLSRPQVLRGWFAELQAAGGGANPVRASPPPPHTHQPAWR
jgi:hypothetical protein